MRGRGAAALAALGAAAVVAVTTAAGGDPDAVEDFVARHWRMPLAPQGPAPADYAPLERSLAPEACGACHPAQLADWRTSLHAAAMGPGVSGQLVELLRDDPAQALGCHTCHAPLAEQRPLVRVERAWRPNPHFEPDLQSRGVVCAGCHVRAHERFGPPRRDGSVASAAPRSTLPHGGATRTPAFERSEFCRGCHQFEAGGLALEGTLVQDTYNEWRASRFAREGVQCQHCHMPDRRHLWRGIHDPDMVRGGITVTATTDAPRHAPGDIVGATLTVTSTGVGHAFPTYVTPRVILRGELVDADGRTVPGSLEEVVIAREVTLDLARQVFDTRLAPGESATLRYRRGPGAPGLRLRLSVVVEPDAFYTRFFETVLAQGAGRGAPQLREALAATRRSAFTVFVRETPLR
jgi:hypothetical protein